MGQIVERKWDDLVGRHDLRGRHVKVIVLEEGEEQEESPWLRSLRAWVDDHEPLGHWVDDSRESIYFGTSDDPR